MELKSGDWVATQKGERGKVIHTSRLTVFVAFLREGQTDIIGAFLESDLTKIESPTESSEGMHD
jgi:hypothetical protein